MRHTIFGGILFLLLALGVSGCGRATPYQPENFRGGFSERQRQETVFEIEFTGNGYTSKSVAHVYAMRRAAEVTLAHNFLYFRVIDTEDKSYSVTAHQSYKIGDDKYYTKETRTHPRFILTIILLTPQQKEYYSEAFEAKAVLAQTLVTGFVLNEAAWSRLQMAVLPDEILRRLEPLKNEKFEIEAEFVFAVKKALGPENYQLYGAEVLKQAERYNIW